MDSPAIDIQYVRLDDDVRPVINRLAREANKRVSEIANEVLRAWLSANPPAE
jgi:hypothetical protein